MTTTGSQPPSSWRDDFSSSQHPKVTPVDDLSRFVMARVTATEDAPQFDVPQAYDKPAGPIAHRYAAEMRRDMIAFRKIVTQYVEIRDAYETETDPDRRHMLAGCALAAAGAMSALAERWSDHPDWREEWGIE